MKKSTVKVYNRNGKHFILCAARKRLILKTPEELIRQQVLNNLIVKNKVPLELITVEHPLTKFKKGIPGRADIVVSSDLGCKKPLMVLECKSGHLGLTNTHFRQLEKYNKVFNAKYIVLTNGSLNEVYRKGKSNYEVVSKLPSFKELIHDSDLTGYIVPNQGYTRISDDRFKEKKIQNSFLKVGVIGVDSEKKHYPFFMNLYNLLFDDNSNFQKLSTKGVQVKKDLGVKQENFGNAGGGSWYGEYKKLLVSYDKDESATIGIGLFAKKKSHNDPRFGNTKGHTILVVSVDNNEKSHNSLQLCLDNSISVKDNVYTITHSGRMTNGAYGGVSVSDVKVAVEKHAPHLIKNGEIQLGILDNNVPFYSKDAQCKTFIKNLIEYALIRDELRAALIKKRIGKEDN
jgi:hypothetical protein